MALSRYMGGWALALLVSACATTSEPESSARVAQTKPPPPPLLVRAETVLPERFGVETREIPLLVPERLLNESEVTRPRAEVRSGPGSQFELTDEVLPQGAKVIVFSQVGVWRKVLVPSSGRKGWVHQQALAEPRPTKAPLPLDARELPTVLALRPVEEAKSFPARESRAVAIPKGTMFRSLMDSGNETLVWLPETNSVLWLSRKDVQ